MNAMQIFLADEPRPRPDRQAQPAGEGRDLTRGRRIVIVEDDFLSLLEEEHVAEDLGMEVMATASRVDEAIALIERHQPELLMLDINLGSDRDGIDIAKWARQRFGIRSLFVTAYSDEAMKQRAAECDPLGWHVKPFTSASLSEALVRAVRLLRSNA